MSGTGMASKSAFHFLPEMGAPSALHSISEAFVQSYVAAAKRKSAKQAALGDDILMHTSCLEKDLRPSMFLGPLPGIHSCLG